MTGGGLANRLTVRMGWLIDTGLFCSSERAVNGRLLERFYCVCVCVCIYMHAWLHLGGKGDFALLGRALAPLNIFES